MNAFKSYAAVVALVAVAGAGCATKERTGAVVGAAGGAAAGAIIGKVAGSTAKGAIIGAAVGGAAGAVIGGRMDKQAAELEKEIAGAEIERVGEGILVTFDSGILFDYDSATVKPAARDNLRNLAASLQKYPGSNVMLVGHTDADGADAYNQGLSERRAAAAAAYLASQGVPRSSIDATGRGESEPVASNDTAAGKTQNRRVELAIFASEAYRAEIAKRGGGASLP